MGIINEKELFIHPVEPKYLELIKMGDLLKMDIKEPKWLVDRLLPECGTSLLIAKPKTGKSTLTRDLALAVAKGNSFLGRATKKGNVIYLAMEESLAEVKKHYKELGATEEDEVFIYTELLPKKNRFTILRDTIKKLGASFIIIDTLHRCINVNEGNSYAEMTRALDLFLELSRELNCHFLLVHHTRKGDTNGAESALGSQAIFASVDTALTMSISGLSTRTIESEQRYGESIPKTSLNFDAATRSYSLGETESISRAVARDTRIEDAIINFIMESDSIGLTQEEILKEITGQKEAIIKALKSLSESDTPTLIKTGAGVRGNPYIYSLPC